MKTAAQRAAPGSAPLVVVAATAEVQATQVIAATKVAATEVTAAVAPTDAPQAEGCVATSVGTPAQALPAVPAVPVVRAVPAIAVVPAMPAMPAVPAMPGVLAVPPGARTRRALPAREGCPPRAQPRDQSERSHSPPLAESRAPSSPPPPTEHAARAARVARVARVVLVRARCAASACAAGSHMPQSTQREWC